MNAIADLIDPRLLATPWTGEALPVAVIDFDSSPDEDGPMVLPPFPVIGIGARRGRLAGQVDAIVGSAAVLEPLLASVRARPLAAAVAVQLLRLIEGMPASAGLVAESLAYGLLQGGADHAAWLASRRSAPLAPAGTVIVTRDGPVLNILLDRPDAHNAIDRPMRDALREAFELAALDPDIERVVMRGAGRTFSLGADLGEFGTTRDPARAHAIRMATLPAQAIVRCAEKLEVHVAGGCVGAGLEMAAFASRLSAGRRAWFQLPELAMGLIPGAGGCVSLSRRIGRQRTTLLILSGRRLTAATALEWGLIDCIVDD